MDIKDRVLVIEDDKSIRNFFRTVLEANNYDVLIATTGAEGYSMVTSQCPDVVILDLGLPDMDGMEVLKSVRKWSNLPVVVVSARNHERDKVEALDYGADDYLVKPFEIVELLARVETVLRRAGKTKDRLQIGDVTIDESSMQVTKAGQPVSLTKKEYELLRLFARNQNMALFRETIYERVWDGEYTGDSRTVDLHVQRLRKKLGWQDRLSAVYKVGYRLEVKE